MKNSMALPDNCKIVIVLDKLDADSLGSLLNHSIKETQKGEKEANQLPPVGRLLNLRDALQLQSYALADSVWLKRAKEELRNGQTELDLVFRNSTLSK